MRALETGRFVVRATNDGVTAIIGPSGQPTAVLPRHVLGRSAGPCQPCERRNAFLPFRRVGHDGPDADRIRHGTGDPFHRNRPPSKAYHSFRRHVEKLRQMKELHCSRRHVVVWGRADRFSFSANACRRHGLACAVGTTGPCHPWPSRIRAVRPALQQGGVRTRAREAFRSAEVAWIPVHRVPWGAVGWSDRHREGPIGDADAHYRRSGRIARKWLPSDPVAATGSEIALREAALERNGASPGAVPPDVPHPLRRQGVPFGYFAMASNMLIDARLQSGRVVEALAVVDELLLHARGAGLTNLERLLAALRVTVLVIAGRIDDAERAWRHDALPEAPADCVDLGSQTWREMEAVAEARARLSIAVGRWAEARSLLRELRALAAERCLRRIEMRALALSIMLSLRIGRKEASVRRLEEYLVLYAECPNAGPLLRDGGNLRGAGGQLRGVASGLSPRPDRAVAPRRDAPRREFARSVAQRARNAGA